MTAERRHGTTYDDAERLSVIITEHTIIRVKKRRLGGILVLPDKFRNTETDPESAASIRVNVRNLQIYVPNTHLPASS